MRKLEAIVLAALVAVLGVSSDCRADTFTHLQTSQVLHGYATGQRKAGKTLVHTEEEGPVELNLTEWQVTADKWGRNNKVIVIELDDLVMYEVQTRALDEAITKGSDEGPLFILLEIDTLGGRTDLTKQVCGAIARTDNCRVIALIKGGKYAGAISAGAAVALACDKIYMVDGTVIGAASLVALSKTGLSDVKETYGEAVGEKLNSAWRAYLAALAERHHRPRLLAAAMVDKDLEVIEVTEPDNRLFVEPADKTPQQNLVHTWSKKGSLLTLTAQEAVKCRIADKVVNSRQEVLRDLGAEDAEIIINSNFQNAARELRRAKLRLNKLNKSIDLRTKQLNRRMSRPKTINVLRKLRSDYKALIALAKRYPDFNINIRPLQKQLNTVEALYEDAKTGW